MILTFTMTTTGRQPVQTNVYLDVLFWRTGSVLGGGGGINELSAPLVAGALMDITGGIPPVSLTTILGFSSGVSGTVLRPG